MKILRAIAFILPAAYILLYILLALWRISYPYELEWQEGSMVDHVRRVLLGLPIYTTPSLDFVPSIYPPLYFWISAALAKLIGIGFEPLRIVSFAASLCSMAFIVLLVRRETGRVSYGILAAGLFAATYRITGGWFDVGRVDSLFLMLVLAAACLIRCRESFLSWIVGGFMLTAAVFTKQVAVAPAIMLIIYGWWINRRLAAAITLTFTLTTVLAVLWLNSVTNGWFLYYTFALPAAHKLIFSSALYFICRGVCNEMGIALLFTIAGLMLYKRCGERKSLLFWMLFLFGMFAAAGLPFMKAGGWNNHLIPAFAALAMTTAVSVYKLTVYFQQSENSRGSAQWLNAAAFVWLAILIQLSGLLYSPSGRIPTYADQQAGRRFIERLSQFSGDVLVFSHGYLPRLAGKKPHANSIAVTDVLSGDESHVALTLRADLLFCVESGRYEAIVLDRPDDLDFLNSHFKEHYRLAPPMFDHPDVFWPVSGYPVRPNWVYVRNDDEF